jgi:hypothetical protein
VILREFRLSHYQLKLRIAETHGGESTSPKMVFGIVIGTWTIVDVRGRVRIDLIRASDSKRRAHRGSTWYNSLDAGGWRP